MPDPAVPQRFVSALYEIATAPTAEECARRIEDHASRLFPELSPRIHMDAAPSAGGDVVPMVARGRIVAALELTGRADRLLGVFAAHAAVALDNACMLEEHQAAARDDPLTGLRNHREFQDAVESAIAHGERTGAVFSVVVFDLDRFKLVNDRDGHAAGDRMLRGVAAAIESACRTTDLAFRVGGDEFALLLPAAGADEGQAIARRASEAIRELGPEAFASYGVATWPLEGATRSNLLECADRAMYAMKGQLRGAGGAGSRAGQHSRLRVAARLASRLAPTSDVTSIAQISVDALRSAFGFYLAVIQRLDSDGMLRVVAGAGPLAEQDADFLAWEQSIDSGVNGRVARTGVQALVPDTRNDPDYLRRDPRSDPGSELSLPIFVAGQVWGVMNLEQLATHAFDEDDVLLAELIAAQLGAALHRCMLFDELEHGFATTLGALCDALEAKDSYTADHAHEVAALAETIGRRMELEPGDQRNLRYAALLHDIGKIGIRSDLLSKPAKLTDDEYAEIKRHSEIGAQLLSRIPMLEGVAPVVRAIHERYDGAGYPDGLAGKEIPLAARIVGACDALHAMRSDRPYRSLMSLEDAIAELQRNSGTQFDPRVVEVLIAEVQSEVDSDAEPVAFGQRAA